MKLFAFALALVPLMAASLEVDKAKSLGNPSAPLRIEIYSDFQCPACKTFHEQVLPELMKNYVVPGKVYVVNHEFPLPMHPYSREAAGYATASAHIGRYQQVADSLFSAQNTWGATGKVWDTVATALTPTEQKKVLSLVKEPGVAAEIQQDVDLGRMAQINETPTLIVFKASKKYPFPGPNPGNLFLLKSLIDGLLK